MCPKNTYLLRSLRAAFSSALLWVRCGVVCAACELVVDVDAEGATPVADNGDDVLFDTESAVGRERLAMLEEEMDDNNPNAGLGLGLGLGLELCGVAAKEMWVWVWCGRVSQAQVRPRGCSNGVDAFKNALQVILHTHGCPS